jgi:hypothetical protein
MNTEQDFDNAADQWLRQHRFTSDAQTLQRIALRVRENLEKLGGYVSISSYERGYLELVAERKIQPFRGTVSQHVAAESAPAIPQEIIDWIENPRVSSFEQRKRYSQDPQFKRYYDLYASLQLKAKVAAEQNEETLTVEEYNSMRAVDVARKYRASAAFKRGVDRLVAEGKI